MREWEWGGEEKGVYHIVGTNYRLIEEIKESLLIWEIARCLSAKESCTPKQGSPVTSCVGAALHSSASRCVITHPHPWFVSIMCVLVFRWLMRFLPLEILWWISLTLCLQMFDQLLIQASIHQASARCEAPLSGCQKCSSKSNQQDTIHSSAEFPFPWYELPSVESLVSG